MNNSFQDAVVTKYNIFNSLFLSLPYRGIFQTGSLLPLLTQQSEIGFQEGKTPRQIIETFFEELLETATEKVMALVGVEPEQVHIEYESEECKMEILKGFEVINLKQPKGESVMTVTSNSLKFNKATAVELNYAPYIKVLLNAKTRQIAIQPCSEKDPNAIKFSNEESKQTYAISIKVPAIQVEFRRMLPFEDDNGGKLSYTLNGTLYPDEQVVIYDIGDVKPETEKKRRGRRKKSEIEAEQKEN